jgi:putative effector of murein hydrolase
VIPIEIATMPGPRKVAVAAKIGTHDPIAALGIIATSQAGHIVAAIAMRCLMVADAANVGITPCHIAAIVERGTSAAVVMGDTSRNREKEIAVIASVVTGAVADT